MRFEFLCFLLVFVPVPNHERLLLREKAGGSPNP